MNTKYIKIYIVALLITLLIGGCGHTTNEQYDGKINVCTSFYTMYDFAQKIGGEKINLKNIIPQGTEPHSWEPSPKDILTIKKADVFIYNGIGMEPWFEKIEGSIKNGDVTILEASKGIELLKGTHSHGEGQHKGEDPEKNKTLEYDPHVWLDPLLAKKQMESIKDVLIKVDPQNSPYYEKNYEENARKLDELDREYKATLQTSAKKDIIVGHGAFGYLCKAYGLHQNAIEGLNSEFEPSPAKMAEAVKFIKDKHIKVVFTDGLSDPKVIRAVANEVGAEVLTLDPLGTLTEQDISRGKEYFSVMRENLKALQKALE